jgi:hypothetical protein
MKDVEFHVLREQTHGLLLSSLQYFHSFVNIVLSVDNICTLANVIIVDPTQADLVSWPTFSHGVVTSSVVIQVKEKLYRDCYLMAMFFPLAIEIFGCFHQQANNFLYQCVNMV